MSAGTSAQERERRLSAELREQETVKPLELYFDLVFVLGFTQCTALMAANPSWEAVAAGHARARGAVVGLDGIRLAHERHRPRGGRGADRDLRGDGRAAGRGAVRPGGVRRAGADVRDRLRQWCATGHIALYVLASRDDPALRRSVLDLAISTPSPSACSMGHRSSTASRRSAVGARDRARLGGPALFGLEGWRLVPAHFAERHNLVIILALGESIVALGVGAEVDLSAGVIAAAVLGVALAVRDLVDLLRRRRAR